MDLHALGGLKKVLHAHARAGEAGRELDADLIESWRPEADHRIAREAESLLWDTDDSVQLPIGVFVVKYGKGVTSDRYIAEVQLVLGGGNCFLQRLWILFAVRKVLRNAGQAGVNGPAGAAQRTEIDLHRRTWRGRRNQRHGDQSRCEFPHRSNAYQPLPPVSTSLIAA